MIDRGARVDRVDESVHIEQRPIVWEIIVRVRTMALTVAALLAAIGVAGILALGQAQAAWDVAGYTWSN